MGGRLDVRDVDGVRIALLTISGPAAPFAADALTELQSLFDDAAGQTVDALAVIGAGRAFQYFVDVDWSRVPDREAAHDYFRQGQTVLRRLSESDCPTFAFIDDDASGGGLELALHCGYRAVSDAVGGLSMPQVQFGFAPGWGGCALTSQLVGARGAVDLIVRNPLTNGKPTKPAKAVDLGVIDVQLPADGFVDAALAWAAHIVTGAVQISRNDPDRGAAWDDAVDRARTWVDGRVRGGTPAPYRALDLIAQARTASLDEMYAAEADAAADLVMTEQARATSYAHALITSHAPTPQAEVTGVRKVGVVGAGTMAAQLAALLLTRMQVPVVVVHRNDAGLDRVRAAVEKAVPDEEVRRQLTLSTDAGALADTDLVLEAVAEDAAVKRDVLQTIASATAPACIIATGTSSLSVTEFARSLPKPERVVGLHFFNPVDLLPLLEVVHTELTDEAVRRTAGAVGAALGKIVVNVADQPAFVFNRLMVRLFGEVLRLAEEGTPLPKAEAAMEPLGLPMSPTQLIVFTSLSLITTVAERMHEAFPDRYPVPTSLQTIVRAGKTGFYIHQDGQRVVDPEVYALADRPEELIDRTADEVRDIALAALAQEIALMLDDGVVADVRDIDLALLIGGNFPMHLGGITPYLDREGISERVTGKRFLPPGVASLP